MGGSRAKVGPDQEPAGWFDFVVVIDPETGLPVTYGGGGGGGGDVNITQVGGVDVGTDVPVSDAAAEASLSSIDTKLTDVASETTLQAVQAALETPADELPPEPLLATSSLTAATIAKSTSGDTTLVAAVSGQTTRVHRMKFTCDAAALILVKRGSTTIDRFRFPSTGGAAILEFSQQPWYVTAGNEAFVINSSTTANIDGSVEYVTSA
ncbi:MAG TPA: hypothetical protein VIO94_16010 [Phenylobacterium sp.]